MLNVKSHNHIYKDKYIYDKYYRKNRRKSINLQSFFFCCLLILLIYIYIFIYLSNQNQFQTRTNQTSWTSKSIVGNLLDTLTIDSKYAKQNCNNNNWVFNIQSFENNKQSYYKTNIRVIRRQMIDWHKSHPNIHSHTLSLFV